MNFFDLDLSERVTAINNVTLGQPDASKYVLCWLQQTLRAYDNPVIDAAVDLANQLSLPVLVYHGIRDDYPYASDRLHAFLLGAGRDLQNGCTARGLRCVSYVERDGKREKGLVYRLAERAAAVVIDDQPVFAASDQTARFAAKCDKPVFAVNGACLVPTRLLPSGLTTTPEFRKAHGELRAAFEMHRSEFTSGFGLYSGPICFDDDRLGDRSDAALGDLMTFCTIDHTLAPSDQFEPSVAAAERAMAQFVASSLKMYANRRNNPADESGVSRLSPYLHFGLIGPRRITAAVRAADAPANAKWKYLDELLTWREYFHYLAHHDEHATKFSSLAEKPRESLLAHADDPRPTLYTLTDLVHGRTDDETWNAAQHQWLETGYMHNNLRMYWGKQLIKWTRDPQTAWQTACYLNDRLSLDGRDPATYGNMKWVFGMSRPGYRELPIYGWVAPKSDGAIRKREGAAEWIKRWADRMEFEYEIDVPAGFPHDIFIVDSINALK